MLKWLMSGRQGIGGKLTGIGVYVQPLGEEMDKSEILSTTWWKILPASRCVPDVSSPYFMCR